MCHSNGSQRLASDFIGAARVPQQVSPAARASARALCIHREGNRTRAGDRNDTGHRRYGPGQRGPRVVLDEDRLHGELFLNDLTVSLGCGSFGPRNATTAEKCTSDPGSVGQPCLFQSLMSSFIESNASLVPRDPVFQVNRRTAATDPQHSARLICQDALGGSLTAIDAKEECHVVSESKQGTRASVIQECPCNKIPRKPPIERVQGPWFGKTCSFLDAIVPIFVC